MGLVEVEATVLAVVEELLQARGVAPWPWLTASTRLDTLPLDSLDRLEGMMRIEERLRLPFGVLDEDAVPLTWTVHEMAVWAAQEARHGDIGAV